MTKSTPKTDYHPEIEAIFDAAQDKPVLTTVGDKEVVNLSVKAFEDALAAGSLKPSDIRHQVIERGEKPNVVIIERETFDNLAVIKDFFANA